MFSQFRLETLKMIKTKEKLYQKCETYIDQRIQSIQDRLRSIEESKNTETKSSAGDKYETGRAMMQIEEDKANAQLQAAQQVKLSLSRIDIHKRSEKVQAASLVYTNRGVYFIAIGLGKVEWEGQLYFCVSANAPIAIALMGKSAGDQVVFNQQTIEIKEIV